MYFFKFQCFEANKIKNEAKLLTHVINIHPDFVTSSFQLVFDIDHWLLRAPVVTNHHVWNV